MDDCSSLARISGVAANREQCPAIPYTPEEYAAEAKRARDAGASVVHIHARYPDGTPSYRVEEYRAITQAILAEAPDLIINYSTGAVGVSLEDRVHQVTTLKPELGALEHGLDELREVLEGAQVVRSSTSCSRTRSPTSSSSLEKMNSVGVKPECECFDTGHIGNVLPLIDMGILITPPVQFSLIMGVLGGAPPDARTLAHMASLVPEPHTWEVIGISRKQWQLVTAATSLGRQRPCRPGGQLLSADRRDGRVERRPRRERGPARRAFRAHGCDPPSLVLSCRPARPARISTRPFRRDETRAQAINRESLS